MTTYEMVRTKAEAAHRAAGELAVTSTVIKNKALLAMATRLKQGLRKFWRLMPKTWKPAVLII